MGMRLPESHCYPMFSPPRQQLGSSCSHSLSWHLSLGLAGATSHCSVSVYHNPLPQ